jgi:DNA adenine methylase
VAELKRYAGGAGLALRLLFEEFAGTIVINDMDPLVHAFWCMCISEPERFIGWIERTPVSVATWKRCKEKIRRRESEDDFELATSFFFLNLPANLKKSFEIIAETLPAVKKRYGHK